MNDKKLDQVEKEKFLGLVPGALASGVGIAVGEDLIKSKKPSSVRLGFNLKKLKLGGTINRKTRFKRNVNSFIGVLNKKHKILSKKTIGKGVLGLSAGVAAGTVLKAVASSQAIDIQRRLNKKSQAGNVRFIRVRGRIVPIRSKKK